MTPAPRVCLHHLVEAQVRRTPNAVALEFDGGTRSYAALDAEATKLAAVLRARGVGPETLVGLACERSPEMMVALLGIMKAGGAYVPLDLEAPRARLADILEQCGRPLVVTTTGTRVDLPEADVVHVDRLPADVAPSGPSSVGPDNLIYVIFTSGSTGRPKGVMTEHAPVSNRLLWMMAKHPLGPGDKVLHKTPIYFDVSVWEMFWPLCVGATLIIARPGGHRDTEYLVHTITDAGITVAHFVPSMLYAFLEHPDVGRCTSLTRVYCSGEALSPELQERFFARLDAELHNLYGPTEAAIEVSHWRCVRRSSTVPIGWPIDNARLYVLDDRQRPVPDGEPGELVIAGAPVGRGYLGRPDLTAAAFLDDPFGAPGDRMYRTGDRALRRPDGAIEYLGRLDNQVKLRGQRIELGEIESCLEAHPRVVRAVVAMKSHTEADQRLIGYVVPRADDSGEQLHTVLRNHVRDRLPGYMVLSSIVAVDQLPLTPSGKVDRLALPDPITAGRARHRAAHDDAWTPYDHQAPRDGVEADLAAIWCDVLHVDTPDRRDGFLDSGGNSLLATVLSAKLRDRLGAAVSPVQILAADSLAALAATITGVDRAAAVDFPIARSLDELRLDRIDTMSEGEIDELLVEFEPR